MPNPTYGDTYDSTLPTPSFVGITRAPGGSVLTYGNSASVNTGGAEFRFGIVYGEHYDGRFAYQVRYRESANDPNWDGGETWTDWQDGNGVTDAWEELYSGTTGTPVETTSWMPPNVTVVTSVFKPSIPWSTVDTYDAIEYRVQCWYIFAKGGVVRYGSPETKTIRINFLPTFTATATASAADFSLTLQLTVDDWGRGAQSYTVNSLAFSDGGTFGASRTSADGTFTYSAAEVGESLDSATVDIVGYVYANGTSNGALLPYTVTQSITVEGDSGLVTQPVVAITDNNGAKEFKVTDDSYDSVTVTASWGGGSYVLNATKSGGYWYADIVLPFNVTATWTVAAYKEILNVLYFNTDSGTLTESGLRYELRADDGSTLTMTLEAKEQMTWDVDSAAITLASGRTVARHGLGNKRTWTLRGQLLGSSHSATSDWIDALAILNLPQNLTYRNPYGEVARVCVTSWTRNPASIWDVLDISVSFTEVE